MRPPTLSLCALLKWFGVVAVVAVVGLPLRVAATTVVPPEFSVMVDGSDYIIRAVVRNVHSEKKTAGLREKIVTLVDLDVTETVSGTPPTSVTLQFLGGRVGDEELTVEGMPHFRVGDEDILFVQGNGRAVCPLYAMMHGRYPIVTEAGTGRKHVTRVNGERLRNTAQISAPLTESAQTISAGSRTAASVEALSPEQFIAEIKAHLGRNAGQGAAK